MGHAIHFIDYKNSRASIMERSEYIIRQEEVAISTNNIVNICLSVSIYESYRLSFVQYFSSVITGSILLENNDTNQP